MNQLHTLFAAMLLTPLTVLHATPAEDSGRLDQLGSGVYSSPFMQRKEGEFIVTVTVGGKRVLYDFDKAIITESHNPKRTTKP
jgi:hypothetical protein